MHNHNDTLFSVSYNSINHFDFEKLVQSDELMYIFFETMKKESQFKMCFLCDDDYFFENYDNVYDKINNLVMNYYANFHFHCK